MAKKWVDPTVVDENLSENSFSGSALFFPLAKDILVDRFTAYVDSKRAQASLSSEKKRLEGRIPTEQLVKSFQVLQKVHDYRITIASDASDVIDMSRTAMQHVMSSHSLLNHSLPGSDATPFGAQTADSRKLKTNNRKLLTQKE
ncbi:hypothetical protein HK100_008759, partial [Physocladia obscura]